MSSHHTQKAINLHHDQVNAARERRMLRKQEAALERQAKYNERRRQARYKYFFIMALFISLWAAWQMTIATGTYLVLKFLNAG